jgi:hypothetical protein
MIQVKSKTVSALDYKPKEEILLVRFHSGVWYQYENVSEKEYDTIIKAESVGSTLRRITKDKLYKKI